MVPGKDTTVGSQGSSEQQKHSLILAWHMLVHSVVPPQVFT
jgi:hypothetical protein